MKFLHYAIVFLLFFNSCIETQTTGYNQIVSKVEAEHLKLMRMLAKSEYMYVNELGVRTSFIDSAISTGKNEIIAKAHLNAVIIYNLSDSIELAQKHFEEYRKFAPSDKTYFQPSTRFWQNETFPEFDFDSLSSVLYEELDKTKLLPAYLASYILNYKMAIAYNKPDYKIYKELADQQYDLARGIEDSSLYSIAYKSRAKSLYPENRYIEIIDLLDSSYMYNSGSNQRDSFTNAQEHFYIYYRLGLFKQAAQYSELANSISSKMNSPRAKALGEILIANAHRFRKNFDSSVYHRKVAQNFLRISPYSSKLHKMNLNHVNMASDYIDLAKYKEAQAHIDSSMAIMGSYRYAEQYLLRHILELQGTVHRQTLQLDSALVYYDRCLAMCDEEESEIARMQCYFGKYEIYKLKKNYVLSLQYFESYQEINDRLANNSKLELKDQFFDSEKLRKSEKSVQKLELINLENKRQATRLRTGIIFIVFIAVLIILVVWLLYNSKQKKLLIESTTKDAIIKQFESEIQTIEIHSLASERKKIAAEFHDKLLSEMAGIVQLGSKYEREYKENKAIEFSNLVSGAKNVYTKARTMMHQLQRHDSMTEDKELFSVQLSEFIRSYIKPLGIKVNMNFHGLHQFNSLSIKKQIELLRCAKEILANILKHSKATEIEIITLEKSSTIQTVFRDNGIGFDHQITKLGMGLDSIIQRIKSLNGEVLIESEPQKGTSITLEIPI